MPIEKKILDMLDLGREPFQFFFKSKLAKIAKVKCTHRSTNLFDASICTIARPPLLCGYTPLWGPTMANCGRWKFGGV